MKTHADQSVPLGGIIFEGGASTFINQGTNGRWRDLLEESDVTAYEERSRRELGEECAQWLATGNVAT